MNNLVIDMPLVSVYILCYNHEKYVAQSIESVLNQTYENIELVIVDNASSDNSVNIINKYAENDKRIKFHGLTINTFPSYGLNFAIRQCTGKYIVALSADDYFALDKIYIQLNYVLHNKADVCFTWVHTVNDYGAIIDSNTSKLFNQNFDDRKTLLEFFVTNGNTLCATSCMIKKEVFNNIGYFDLRQLQTQDFELWLRIAKKYNIDVLQRKLTYYRIRNDRQNLSLNKSKQSKLRCLFESCFHMQHILDFDLKVLTDATGYECNHINKYKNLFNSYVSKHNYPYATAIIFAMYNALGADFEFPSELYQDFLELYSGFDLFNIYNMHGVMIELFWRNSKESFSSERSYCQNFVITNSKYEFDLSKIGCISELRIDLANIPCKVSVKYIKILDIDGYLHNAEIVRHNADKVDADGYLVYHDDFQLLIAIPVDLKNKLSSILIDMDLLPLNSAEQFAFYEYHKKELALLKQELIEMALLKQEIVELKQINAEKCAEQFAFYEYHKKEVALLKQEIINLEQFNVEKCTEIFNLKNTLSWKSTQPLRLLKKWYVRLFYRMRSHPVK